MQADQLAEIGQPDAITVTRHLFEDREGAPERLNADPLPVVGIVVDVGLRRLHQLGDRGLARSGLLLNGLLSGTRCHESQPPRDGAALYQAIGTTEQRADSAYSLDPQHTTISIDVQYYGK